MYKSAMDGIKPGNVILRGNRDAPSRLFVIAAQHGQEIAGPEALATFLEKWNNDDWPWPHVQVAFAFDDIKGYAEEGYGFVSTEGEEGCWPPLWRHYQDQGKGYWMWYDRNSSWGNTNISRLPPALQGLRKVVDVFRPTFCLSLHETVHSEVEENKFWAGADPLLIEEWPLSVAEGAGLSGKNMDLLGSAAMLLVAWLWPGFQPKYLQWVLRNNPHYQLITDIVAQYEDGGFLLTGKKWMEYLRLGGSNIILDQGRIFHNPQMLLAEWRTVTGYCAAKFGCPGVTIETFPTGTTGLRGLDKRVEQAEKFLTATLDALNEQQYRLECEGEFDKELDMDMRLEPLPLAERERLLNGTWGDYR